MSRYDFIRFGGFVNWADEDTDTFRKMKVCLPVKEPVWMFETAFEPVPEQRRGDRIRTLTEEMNNHHVAEKALNEKCYALSVELLSECGGSLDDNGEQSSTYLHVVDRDPVELVITNASLRKDGKIFIMGYSYYTGEEYEQECDVESGMDILNFILSQKSFECYE